MSNPAFDPRSTKPGSAGWYEPDGTYHPFNVDLEPDAEYAARVKDLGARSAIASLGGVIASASSTDQVRAAKSSIDALLYEAQHPKQAIYEGPDVAVGIGAVVALTPWIDLHQTRGIGYYVANTGANPLANVTIWWSENPAGAAPWVCQAGNVAAIAAGAAWYSQSDSIVALGRWANTYTAPTNFSYIRINVTGGAAATTARCNVVGAR